MLKKNNMAESIVYVNTDFYSYNKEIIQSLKDLNMDVLYFNYKPCHNSLSKFLFKTSKIFKRITVSKVVRKIVKQTKGKNINVYLMINPVTFSKNDVVKIFRNHATSNKILYLWDSITTYPSMLKIVSEFTKCCSFDPIDCKKYGFKYRPTFYDFNEKQKLIIMN